jgi:DNA-binding beta-propeller fold protein YncE
MRSALLLALIAALILPFQVSGAALRQVAIVDLPGRPGFDDLAIVRGMLVMTHSGAGSVDVFDQAKRRVVAHIEGIEGARGIAVDETSGRVYVGSLGRISVIDANGWKVVSTIDVDGSADSLLLLAQPARLFYSDVRSQKVIAIDLSSRDTVGTTSLGGRPGYLAFDTSRKLIYVTVQDQKQIVVLDPGLKIVKRFAIAGSQPTGVAYDASHDRIYVSIRHAVVTLNPNTGEELGRIAAPAGVDRLWLDEGNQTLVAAAGGSVFLASTAGARLAAGDEIPTQVKGYAVAFDPQRKLVYLPGGREGRSKLLILKQTGGANSQSNQNAEAALR